MATALPDPQPEPTPAEPAEPGPPAKIFTFGPSALATPANAITVARILAAPVLVAMFLAWGPSYAAFTIGFLIALTDGIDGWLARKQGTTRSGAFLDPLADKAVIIAILFTLAARNEISWIPVSLITAREVSMQVYRTVLGRRGVSIPARTSAKAKTFLQDLAVGLCLLPPVAPHHLVLELFLWAAVALTLVSGVQYVLDGRKAAHPAGPAAGPAPAPEDSPG